ncbi:hypothetical protein SGLAM104S_07775 [Streptomyces glaucescens]
MTRPSSQTRTVRAVMLRCTQPWACSTRRAMSTSEATSAARYGVSGFSASSADSGREGTSSLTIHSEPSSANTSKTWSSRGWSGMRAAACAASTARRTAGSAGRRTAPAPTRPGPPPGPAVAGREAFGQPLGVQHLGFDDLGQRHLADQDFLSAVGVEGPGLGEFVRVGRRKRQAVAVGEDPSRIVVHVASPGRPAVSSVRPASRDDRSGHVGSGCARFASTHDTCRSQPVPSGWEISHPRTDRGAGHALGSKVFVSVCQVILRVSLPHLAALAVYISA